MQPTDKIDVIIYRVREKGLEVILPPTGTEDPATGLLHSLSAGQTLPERLRESECIELDPVTHANGECRKTVAIEADWHELPSLRAMMYEDYRVAKEKAKQHIKNLIPGAEGGAFIVIKEAFKRVMPEQYAYLKELKDILVDKNQTKYI